MFMFCLHRLSQYFDFLIPMNVLAFRSLQSFSLMCFDRDDVSVPPLSQIAVMR